MAADTASFEARIMKNTVSNVVLSVICGLAMFGCGGGGGGSSVEPFPSAIYVARTDPGNVVSFTDMTGTGWVERSTPGHPGAFTFDRRGRMIQALYFDSVLVRYSDPTAMDEETFGSIGSGVNQFDSPTDVAMDSDGRIYVADSENRRLVRINNFSGSGWTTLDLSAYLPEESSIYAPSFTIAIDDADRIYVLPVATGKITRFNNMTDASPVDYGTLGSGQGQFQSPAGISIGPTGSIYIADAFNYRIVRMDDMTGAGWTTYGTDGTGVGQFKLPRKVAFDALGRLYILDRNNKRVVRMDDMTGAGWVSYGTDNTPAGGNGPWCEALVVKN